MFFVRAYGPGEVQVLVSNDGGNFEEASSWRAASRSEVSYRETIMSERSQNVKAVSIVMKSPMPWGFFGLNGVQLLSLGEEAFMLIVGERSAKSEQCLTAAGAKVVSQSCLDAVAAFDGREIFAFQGQHLVHVASGLCLGAVGKDAYEIALQECDFASDGHNARVSWELTANAQLKLPRMGDFCLTSQSGRAIVADCGSSYVKFFLAVVDESGLEAALPVRSGAMLLNSAAARQRQAVKRLQELLPTLDSCKFVSLAANTTRHTAPSALQLAKEGDSSGGMSLSLADTGDAAALAAMDKVYSAIGIDMPSILGLISESSNVLADVRAKVVKSA